MSIRPKSHTRAFHTWTSPGHLLMCMMCIKHSLLTEPLWSGHGRHTAYRFEFPGSFPRRIVDNTGTDRLAAVNIPNGNVEIASVSCHTGTVENSRAPYRLLPDTVLVLGERQYWLPPTTYHPTLVQTLIPCCFDQHIPHLPPTVPVRQTGDPTKARRTKTGDNNV